MRNGIAAGVSLFDLFSSNAFMLTAAGFGGRILLLSSHLRGH